MKQLTLATVGFERYAKTTRRAAFLAEMERVVRWSALRALIAPFYPKPGNGRPPVGVERMLRIYFLQQWFNLSDPAVEEALYDSLAMRRLVGIDLGREPVPDETTVCRFCHLLKNGGTLEKAAAMANHASTSASSSTIAGATSSPSMVERIVIQLAYRHAAVRPSVELLTLRASDRRPWRHAAVRPSVELLALRASDG